MDCLCPYLLIAARFAGDGLVHSWPTAGTNTAAGGMTANHQVPATADTGGTYQQTVDQGTSVCIHCQGASVNICVFMQFKME